MCVNCKLNRTATGYYMCKCSIS